MLERVVIGGTRLGRRLARPLADWPGHLDVITADARTAEDLREEGLPATVADLTDPEILARVVPAPDIVVIAADVAVDVDVVIGAARRAFVDAHLCVIYEQPAPRFDPRVDQVIDTASLAAQDLVTRIVDPGFERTLDLLRTLEALDDPVAVVMHDNPDPDAIGAAVGMVALADAVGTTAVPAFTGDISHQQNRAFVTALALELEELEEPFPMDAYGGIVLVDHAHPGVNDSLDPDTPIDVIVDHHPSREEAEATFVDRRHIAGSTSTLVAHHLMLTGIEFDSTLATALWYGIQVDTAGFRRGVSELDFIVASHLRETVDAEVLRTIEDPRMTAETLDILAASVANRIVRDGVVVSDIGRTTDRDALAQAADYLLTMEGARTVCVLGNRDGMIFASARTRDHTLDLGDAMRLAYGRIGSAGGHEDMAGAQIPTGVLGLESVDDEEHRRVIVERFFEGVEMAGRPLPSGYVEDGDLAD